MVVLCNKSPALWMSKMQKMTALATAEAEYYSASMAGCEVLYLRNLLHRLGFTQKRHTPMYEDTACIEWGNNVIGGRERAKHIDIRMHFAHEVIQNGQMLLVKVQTQMADILTKGLHLRVRRWSPASAVNLKHVRGLCPQEGVGSPRPSSRAESRRPLRGVSRRLIGSQDPS